MTTRVVFWNVQRASNVQSGRAAFVWATAKSWLFDFDVLILAEVTRVYQEFLGDMLHHWRMDGDYFGVRSKVPDVASDCSFIGVWKRTIRPPRFTGGSTTRPILKFRLPNGVRIAGCHLRSSNESTASEEAFQGCLELGSHEAGLLIGDMNVNFLDITPEDRHYMKKIRYSAVHPGLSQTFRKPGRVLDYAWKNDEIGVTAEPPEPGYNDFTIIDHAPIGYTIDDP